MTGTDWLLSLHLLSAVLFGAGITGTWAVLLGGALLPTRPLSVAVRAGSLGAVVFGVWLAIVEDAYHVWDAWIIAALVLWAAGSGLGERALASSAGPAPAARRTAVVLQAASTATLLAVLLVMIWKPGA